jgi:hypothetical protein
MNGIELLANMQTVTMRRLLQKAEEMGLTRDPVIAARDRFLIQEIKEWQQAPGWFPEMLCGMMNKEVAAIRAMRARPMEARDITDSDIVVARSVPFSELITFNREGKTRALCHDDKRPSLTWDQKRNTVKCWPCDKRWDTIAWVQEYQGLRFPHAVKYLLGK